ncbi:hypothetical protein ScPMuIL_006859 [Solemya velum]
MEYGAMRRLDVQFDEVAVTVPSLTSNFAYMCKISGVSYPQGVGKTKKEAKTNAAKYAFISILGLKDDSHENDDATMLCDSMGRRLIIQNDMSGEVNDDEYVERNPIVALQDHCTNSRYSLSIDIKDDPGPFGFICRVEIQGKLVAECTAKNKKEAKRMAATEALDYLQIDHTIHGNQVDVSEEDIIGGLCYKKLQEKVLEVQGFDHYKKSFAAFIVKRGDSEGEVVAMGVGNTCLSAEHITQDGRSLVDSYAVALARRALLKYFHKEMKSYYDGNKIVSIFEETSRTPGLLQLKEYITIHMFMNHPPPGDYAYYSEEPSPKLTIEQEEKVKFGAHFPAFNDDLPGWFCTKNEDGVITPVEEDQAPQQSVKELCEGEDLLVMSCSDKILQWNIVGLQGALFSAFLEPVYLTSIILGGQFDHGHLTRAVCCRVYGILQESLLRVIVSTTPILSQTEYPFPEHGTQITPWCLNWSQGDEKVEMTDGFSGKEIPQSPFKWANFYQSTV